MGSSNLDGAVMSPELELYLERKAICIVDGIAEEEAIRTAYEQVKDRLPKTYMPDAIYRDLKAIGLR